MTKWKGWKAVIRDLIIIWIFTGIGGFTIGISTTHSEPPMFLLGISTIIFGIVGFCFSGCMIENERWKHLITVAIFVWLSSIINIIFGPFTLTNWALGIFPIFIMMGIGGGLSFIFKRSSKDQIITS